MQHVSCFVRLSGDLNNVVFKADATVAEVILLRVIHGEDSVTGIKPTVVGKEKAPQEYDRLKALYGASNFTKDGLSVLATVFPGKNPTLPSKLSDIDIEDHTDAVDISEDPEPEAEAAPERNKGGRPRKASNLMGD
ncbi:hypothetical protein IB275_30525 [Pseudomonas sp. PDM21]|uniref:hypothetical protein n=1 Tax=Pseudomonas sp. PDM21 TaxID=2769257 RepID=UPI0017820F2A|nr:hypothetical protein [Pseudomonas sp. PDM21]MBD9674952.1 hypothetical protein [Pseudomonas sp. PDM21]